MNTLFFQERAQGDAPTDSDCLYIVTISEAALSVAVPVMQLAPFLFGPLKTLHSNKDMQSINQSRLSHFHPWKIPNTILIARQRLNALLF